MIGPKLELFSQGTSIGGYYFTPSLPSFLREEVEGSGVPIVGVMFTGRQFSSQEIDSLNFK